MIKFLCNIKDRPQGPIRWVGTGDMGGLEGESLMPSVLNLQSHFTEEGSRGGGGGDLWCHTFFILQLQFTEGQGGGGEILMPSVLQSQFTEKGFKKTQHFKHNRC